MFYRFNSNREIVGTHTLRKGSTSRVFRSVSSVWQPIVSVLSVDDGVHVHQLMLPHDSFSFIFYILDHLTMSQDIFYGSIRYRTLYKGVPTTCLIIRPA